MDITVADLGLAVHERLELHKNRSLCRGRTGANVFQLLQAYTATSWRGSMRRSF